MTYLVDDPSTWPRDWLTRPDLVDAYNQQPAGVRAELLERGLEEHVADAFANLRTCSNSQVAPPAGWQGPNRVGDLELWFRTEEALEAFRSDLLDDPKFRLVIEAGLTFERAKYSSPPDDEPDPEPIETVTLGDVLAQLSAEGDDYDEDGVDSAA